MFAGVSPMTRLASRIPFRYRLFGLNLASDVELPELPQTPDADEIDLQIFAYSPIPFSVSQLSVRLEIDNVARFTINGGNSIYVEAAAGTSERNVRLYLLGSVLGILLHQRGLLPLHANAVQIGSSAVAFMGSSGSGKSTLAAWFWRRGCRVLTDDVAVVRFSKNQVPHVSEGLPRFRLCRDAIEAAGSDPDSFQRSYSGQATWEKFDVPFPREPTGTFQIPLVAIYVLEEGDELKIERIVGIDAMHALVANTYRGEFLSKESATSHMQDCARIARELSMFRLRRPFGHDTFDALAERISAHAASIVAQEPSDTKTPSD